MPALFILLVSFFSLTLAANANPKTCQVTKIIDGDTIRVDCGGVSDRIRLCGIDSPEKKQAYSKEAKALIVQLLKGGTVEMVEVERDHYQRMVAEVYVGKTFVNVELVKAGLAYEYKKYSKRCPHKIELTQAEEIAQRAKVGVWDGNSYQMPWDFRTHIPLVKEGVK
jgi:micrococcal nuclease